MGPTNVCALLGLKPNEHFLTKVELLEKENGKLEGRLTTSARKVVLSNWTTT